jgi:hypothetical protein
VCAQLSAVYSQARVLLQPTPPVVEPQRKGGYAALWRCAILTYLLSYLLTWLRPTQSTPQMNGQEPARLILLPGGGGQCLEWLDCCLFWSMSPLLWA